MVWVPVASIIIWVSVSLSINSAILIRQNRSLENSLNLHSYITLTLHYIKRTLPIERVKIIEPLDRLRTNDQKVLQNSSTSKISRTHFLTLSQPFYSLRTISGALYPLFLNVGPRKILIKDQRSTVAVKKLRQLSDSSHKATFHNKRHSPAKDWNKITSYELAQDKT